MSSDDPILRALSELPRERASEAFTSRVVARAGEAVEEPSRGWPRAAAAVAAALVLVSGVAAWRLERSRRLENIRGEVSELQSTHRMLEQELRDLRAAEKPPVVYLGGDDKVDIYLDIAELQRLQKTARRSSRSAGPQQTTGDTI